MWGDKLKNRLMIFIFFISFAFVFAGAASATTIKTSQLTPKISNGGIDIDQPPSEIKNAGLVYGQGNLKGSSVNHKLTSLTPLTVISSNPANNSVNIPTTKLIIMKFNRVIKDPNKQLIQLRKADGTVIPVTYTLRNKEIFIDHTPLKQNTLYTIFLKRYSLKDSTGNVLTSTYITKFKTGHTNLLSFKAKLIIPKLGVSPNIYKDSPNHYNAVYHYSDSAYFGTPGDCAFLGHRTTYSAILRYINLLNYGDRIIIKDYTSNKISTYKVVSHEIRYNYQLTHNFKKYGKSNLILKSCYPVGYSYMKWIVHAVLVSTVPI
jgi:sortase (surface protein transpeptidase)